VGGATEHSHQPPDKAKPNPGNQRAKALQLFLIALFGRYTSWSAESDSNARGKGTCLPEEPYFLSIASVADLKSQPNSSAAPAWNDGDVVEDTASVGLSVQPSGIILLRFLAAIVTAFHHSLQI
jgi:hypothetical protein